MKTKQIHLVVDVPEDFDLNGEDHDVRIYDEADRCYYDGFSWRIIEAGEPVGWIDEFGNVFPLAAYTPNGNMSYHDAHKRGWKPLYLHPSGDVKDAERYKALCALLDGPGSMFTQVEIDDNYCEDSIYMTKLLDKYIETSKEK